MPTPNVKIEQIQKITWAKLSIGTKTNMNIVRYTDFEWEVHSPDHSLGSDPSYPKTDHTLNKASGNYLLMTTKFPRQVADRAVLVSDHYDIDNNRSFCLSFFYFTRATSNMGTDVRLEVYQAEANTNLYKIGEILSITFTGGWKKYWITAKAKSALSTNMWFYLVSYAELLTFTSKLLKAKNKAL